MKKMICVLIALILCLSSTALADFVPSPTTGDMTRFEVEVENSAEDTSGFFVEPLVAEKMTDEEFEHYTQRFDVCQFEIDRLMNFVNTFSDAPLGDAPLGNAVSVGTADGNTLVGNGLVRKSVDIEGISIDAINAYFGEVKDAEGNVISLLEYLAPETTADPDATDATDEQKIDKLNIFEFMPIIAGGFEESFGKVNLKMLFSTPYEKDQKVVAMIGRVTGHENISDIIADAEGTVAENIKLLASDEEMAEKIQSVVWTAYEGIGVEIPESMLAAAQETMAQQTEQQGDAELPGEGETEGETEGEPEVELGCIQIVLDPEMVKAIQEGTALLAIVSL